MVGTSHGYMMTSAPKARAMQADPRAICPSCPGWLSEGHECPTDTKLLTARRVEAVRGWFVETSAPLTARDLADSHERARALLVRARAALEATTRTEGTPVSRRMVAVVHGGTEHPVGKACPSCDLLDDLRAAGVTVEDDDG